jgi:hypothetical protein
LSSNIGKSKKKGGKNPLFKNLNVINKPVERYSNLLLPSYFREQNMD